MEITKEIKTKLYRDMFLIRRVEERCNELFAKNLYPGYIHSYMGQEACAVGVCTAMRQNDYVLGTHRARGHYLAKGMALKPMMAEMWGKKTGICEGRGGEMHAADPNLGILGGNGIVGAGIPISVGAGFSAVMRGTDQVTAVFFGEGASNTGGFHESLNMAAAWNLPILFVCENNMYAEMTPIVDVVKNVDIAKRAQGYDIPGETIDGNDVMAVYKAAQAAVARARKGEGPTLLELKTYRWGGHFQGDPCNYRTREEEAAWKAKCPVKRFREYLLKENIFAVDEIEALEKVVNDEVEEAIQYAMDSPLPEPEDVYKYVYAD